MRLVRALVRQKSTAAAAAGKPIAHIYPNSETPVKALDPCEAASRRTKAAPRALATLQRSDATPRKKEGGRLTRAIAAHLSRRPAAAREAARRRLSTRKRAGREQGCIDARERENTHERNRVDRTTN